MKVETSEIMINKVLYPVQVIREENGVTLSCTHSQTGIEQTVYATGDTMEKAMVELRSGMWLSLDEGEAQ